MIPIANDDDYEKKVKKTKKAIVNLDVKLENYNFQTIIDVEKFEDFTGIYCIIF